jgi:hypothetical protein
VISSDGPRVEQSIMHTYGSAPRFSGDDRAGDMLSPASDDG